MATTVEAKTEVVRLISAEGHEFVIDKRAAMVSGTISNLLNPTGVFSEGSKGVIPLREISTPILEKVIQYFYYKLRYNDQTSEIPEFQIEPESVLDVLLAANYLEV
eukprot:TRINITY_DN1416_c1_g2_i1.p1 TRINITY_DN1416_c1_g2~~TRINITY_DN1416_c1_g2_i1.p1  ORF type:complete len:124 (-),score=51.27 TRINITY_DN1416_c1_g2_i1:102-419(-)